MSEEAQAQCLTAVKGIGMVAQWQIVPRIGEQQVSWRTSSCPRCSSDQLPTAIAQSLSQCCSVETHMNSGANVPTSEKKRVGKRLTQSFTLVINRNRSKGEADTWVKAPSMWVHLAHAGDINKKPSVSRQCNLEKFPTRSYLKYRNLMQAGMCGSCLETQHLGG